MLWTVWLYVGVDIVGVLDVDGGGSVGVVVLTLAHR